MAQSRLVSAFETGAIRFNVAESDFIVLKGGYRDSGGQFQTYDKVGVTWGEWKRSDDAACLRKLWSFGSTLCKAELDDLTSGIGTGDRIKFTLAAAAELEKKAVANGMSQPASDVERPSLWTLQRLANNHSLSGKHHHMEWENFVSMEQEDRARRSGSGLKEKLGGARSGD